VDKKAEIDRGRRYDDWMDFFRLEGSVVMRLTRAAAIEVAARAASRNRVISRVEGGVWLDPYFESRGDCIWDGIDPPTSVEAAEENNVAAQLFIRDVYADVFILTAPPLSGSESEKGRSK